MTLHLYVTNRAVTMSDFQYTIIVAKNITLMIISIIDNERKQVIDTISTFHF